GLRKTDRPKDADELLDQFRMQTDRLARRWPRTQAAAALAKARCYESQERYKDAIKCCADSLASNDSLSLQDRVNLLLKKVDLALTSGTSKDVDNLVHDADEAGRLAADLTPSLRARSKFIQAFSRAWRQLQEPQKEKSDLRDAVELVRQAIEIDPLNPEVP